MSTKQVQDFPAFFPSHSYADTGEGKRGTGPSIKCCCYSVAQLHPTLWDPMDYSMPGFPVLPHLSELASTHVHWVSDAIQLPHPLLPPSQSFPASGSFPMSQLFTSGGQCIGASASLSVLPVNIQDWFPLGLTGWISSQFKGLSLSYLSNDCMCKSKYSKSSKYKL